MLFQHKLRLTLFTLTFLFAFVTSYIYEDDYPENEVEKRYNRRTINRVISLLLQKDGLDRNRRQPLGDFGVGSRWNAGSSAANYLQSSHFLNSPFSPGKRKRDDEEVFLDSI